MLSFALTLKRLLGGLRHSIKRHHFRTLFILIAATLLSGTLFYVKVENLHWLDALYFCVVTLTTVGHPEFVPQTSLGKVFTMIYVFAGIGLTFGTIFEIAAGIILPRTRKNKEQTEDPELADAES
ncbi:potassium channel family protein [Paenibacillus sp. DYY-L-2]|uniref:potassium channel family protein n=1 Tax=Paenibacillus sp. DYY-L-2 TaxID=3447013 RepID=UPI003F50308D